MLSAAASCSPGSSAGSSRGGHALCCGPSAGLVEGGGGGDLPPAERARVAYAGHRPLLWGGLSARENLLLCAGLYGLPAELAETALAAADLLAHAERAPP